MDGRFVAKNELHLSFANYLYIKLWIILPLQNSEIWFESQREDNIKSVNQDP